ncbi:hypothetical protein [Kineococcus sp. R86509]|uniref:hypothetical protein n=1 Tax=Kineococcus sp. R86509 TaxID=3093851 RepID=UPI0036D22263
MSSVRQQSEIRPPDARRVAPIGGESSGSRTLLRALDEQLFTTGPWLAIDAANVAVKGVRPATLPQALSLIGQGRVASVVGTLREDVVGVDIDSPTFAGDILSTLQSFCTARGLWHLTRPSGGADGRAHLLLVPAVHRADFEDLVERLRRELGRKADPRTGRPARPLSRAHLDVRTQLRPLSAPHRCKPTPALDEDVLAEALASLPAHLQTLSPRLRESRTASAVSSSASSPADRRSPRAAARSTGLLEPLVPLPRPRRDLPPAWAAYLREGRSAATAAGVDRSPTTRSTIEYDATRQLVLAGYNAQQAWDLITTAHPTAFVKARSNGQRWWWNEWNRRVSEADAWLAQQRSERTHRSTAGSTAHLAPTNLTDAADSADSADPAAEASARAAHEAITRAHVELEATWRSWPAQSRHTLRELMRYALDRMARCEATAVALPQRDVLLDTPIASRNTVATARDFLATRADLLRIETTPQRGESAGTGDVWSLPVRFTHPAEDTSPPPPASNSGGVGTFEPTRVPPPHAAPTPWRAALPLRRALGLPRVHLLEALHVGPTSRSVPDLAHAAGLISTALPTHDQERTVRGHLQYLSEHHLASVDAHGHWSPLDEDDASSTAAVLEQQGRRQQLSVRAVVEHERHEYRARFDADARRQRWLAERQQVLARQAKVDLSRQKAWWNELTSDARRERTVAAAAVFAVLSPAQQAARKRQLAVRRTRAGVVERDRWTAWWNGLSSDQREWRSIQRAWAYHRLPEHTQVELAGAWAEHRARWDLPRPRRVPAEHHDRSAPDVIDLRDGRHGAGSVADPLDGDVFAHLLAPAGAVVAARR